MTTEERFERIEHVTAGLAEERRQDREEFRTLWRDTQRQLNELTVRGAQIAEESRAADQRLEQRMEDADQRSRERDDRLGERIAAMVSAISEFIAASKPSNPPA